MPIAEAKKQYENVVRRELLNELGNYLLVKYGSVYPEYQFLPNRKFRFDFAMPHEKKAVEVDGGEHLAGGGCHQRAGRFISDREKMNLATLHEWKVFRFSYDDLKSRTYQKFI